MRIIPLATLLVLNAASAFPGDEPKVKDVDSLKTLIKPCAEETKWEEIPWMADLWEARKKAALTGKPIVLWEMDGNPMGCG